MALFVSEAWATDAKPADSTVAATGQAADAKIPVPYDLSPGKMMTDNLLILAFLFAIFYFILIQPQQKRLKQHNLLVKGLQKGNKIVTSGGLLGTIVKFEGDDVVLIEIAPNVKVRVARSSVSDIVTKTPVAGENANDN